MNPKLLLRTFSNPLVISLFSVSPLLGHEKFHVPAEDTAETEEIVGKSEVEITVEGDKRVIVANGLPDHLPGSFPNRRNPHTITSQKYRFEIPLNPVKLESPKPHGRTIVGVGLNGVVFDPGTAETWNGDRTWIYEALTSKEDLGLDYSHAHVQPSGAYHYHSVPNGLYEKLGVSTERMTLIGWAADGFPIYAGFGYSDAADEKSPVKVLKSGYKLRKAERPGEPDGPGGEMDGSFASDYEWSEEQGDLDMCNGREGVTPEFPEGTYYYVVTEDFPFIPRFFAGEPSSDFEKKGQGGGGRNGRRQGMGGSVGPRGR
ncbi:YHYH protein [Luteolibacter sp. AS25]|uniref:YHYH protein n=1 Tax=Luteolibacter sp. AS25 TaxID=3135776 RepID=UPI00398A79D3